jgi:lipopolysaccharide transport protein LptA
MAVSRRNDPQRRAGRSRDAVAVTALLGLVPALAAAQISRAPCANAEIAIEAKPFEVDYRNNNAVLREVVITQCDLRIEANEARVTGGLDFEDSRWTISGNVRITAEGGSLKSDKAVVAFNDNVIARATITGTPAAFEQQRADGTTSRGHANTIDYETTSGAVSLRENAWLSDGRNEMTAPQIVYNIKTQRIQGQGQGRASQGSSGGDRIRIVIQPRDQETPSRDRRDETTSPKN